MGLGVSGVACREHGGLRSRGSGYVFVSETSRGAVLRGSMVEVSN